MSDMPGVGMAPNPLIAGITERAKGSDADYTKATEDFKASRERENAARAAQQAAEAPVRQQLKEKLAGGAPAAPDMAQLPKAPTPFAASGKDMQETLALVTALAAIGGALTRKPLTAALNNFSAGVKGYIQGNQDVYAASMKEFEANLKKAKEENDTTWQKYLAAQKKYGTDIQGLQNELQIIAAETQSPIDQEMAARGDIKGLFEMREKTKASMDKAAIAAATMQDRQKQHAETERHNRAMEATAATKAAAASGGVGPNGAKDTGAQDEAAAWDYLIRGHNPPAKSGAYDRAMSKVAQIAKDNGMTTEELVSASADVKTKIAAKKAFETRAQNIGRAENQLLQEIPVMEDAMKSMDLPNLPAAARGKIWVLRQLGDPSVTKLDQAATTVFNEFEGIITGNPGTLNVQDVQQAKHAYEQAQSPQQMKAAIEGMRRIINNAKKANDITRDEIMKGIRSSVNPKGSGGETGKPREFKTEQEAAAAGLAPGTRVTIDGVSGTWQ